MIPAREVMCPVCGELFQEACYGVQGRKVRLKLNHKGLPGMYTYSLTPMKPLKVTGDTGSNTSDPDGSVYTLEEGSLDGSATMPDRIRVCIDDEEAVEFHRCCPHCKGLTEMPVGWGRLPSFVVVTLGLIGEGKSSLLQVLDRVENRRALAQCQPHIRLDTPELNLGKNVLAQRTPVESPGATNMAVVYDESGKPVANVLFRDVAGEIFTKRSLADYKVYNFFRARPGIYEGPDAFMLVHSASQEQEQLLEVYNYINGILKTLEQPWPLTACVITHLDKITGDKVWRSACSSGKPVVVLDEKTFPSFNSQLPQHGYYTKERLVNRMALQNSLVRSHFSLLDPSLNLLPKARGFLVKSCVGEGSAADFTEPINALDPFLWLLNSLRLVSIK